MQNANNHRKYYPLHHFVLLPLEAIAIAASIYHAIHFPEHEVIFYSIAFAFVLLAFGSLLMRQHYALSNQDRIIRLEMRLRYYQLTQQRFETFEKQFSFGQIAALRFASDEELPALVQRTASEDLSAAAIKKSITNWQADDMRV